MINHNPLPKTIFSCLIIISLLRTCIGENTPHCPPSSCGNIPNISYPFRLKNDPQNCGNPKYELACENNTTFLYLDNSQKYPVRAINYPNYTISLNYPDISENDRCSFPNYSISEQKFANDYPYSIRRFMLSRGGLINNTQITSSITFMSCPYPVNNSLVTSSLLLEVTAVCGHRSYGFNESDRRKHTYVKLGDMNGWTSMMLMCTIDLMAMTSLPPKDEKSVSLSDIHSSLLHGFELSWLNPISDYALCILSADTIPRFLCGATTVLWVLIYYVVLPMLALRFIIGMACMLWLVIYKLRRRHLSAFDIIEGFLQSNNNLMPIRYSYKDIKKMTRGFRDKLGQGGYGSVYKGKLRSGRVVAVKLLSNPRENGQDFINEIATIGRIHHVNVVKLVGYCAGRSNNKRALIFDFMPNGSLEKYLFSQQSPNPLSWERKYEIAVGVARGIEYLHRGCDIQILHFDIKPHNILLDDNFTPKISDFGLAKLYSTDNNTVTLTAARGTIGYVAPELINRSIGSVSYKADVYSFGMLLMELVGLNKNIMANDEESSQYFPYCIYDCFDKGKDIEMGDDDDDDDDDDGHAKRITKKMTIVGLWCIQMSPVDRPSMSEVVKMLESQNGNLQVPPRPSEPTRNFANFSDQTWGTESTGSMALLDDDATSDQRGW